MHSDKKFQRIDALKSGRKHVRSNR